MSWGILALAYVVLRWLGASRAFSQGRGGKYLVRRYTHKALAKSMRRF